MNNDLYLSFIEEDLVYLEGIEKDVKMLNKAYLSKVFDSDWPKLIKSNLNLIKIEISQAIDSLRENLEKAKEMRRLIDEAYQRQVIENQRNVGIKGCRAADSLTDVASIEQKDMGLTS